MSEKVDAVVARVQALVVQQAPRWATVAVLAAIVEIPVLFLHPKKLRLIQAPMYNLGQLIAVSYTHLDVYKRQALSLLQPCFSIPQHMTGSTVAIYTYKITHSL